jgi:hypothetical protein
VLALEAACAAIVALFVVTRARLDERPWRFVRRLALLAAASWVAEDSVIHAYGFYQYDPGWSLFVDRVPLMILVIWPVVIHSAWDLVCRLRGGPSLGAALAAALMVLADASLIEPVAVEAGLWSWNAPGLFAVPPIGLLGWAYFAGLCLVVLHLIDRAGGPWWWELALLVGPAAATHPLLLATWWGALRWVSATVPPWPAVALAWAASACLAAAALRSAAGARVPLVEMALRVPAAGFFFALLALHGRDVAALVAWAFAFAPPYLVLTARAARAARSDRAA